MCWNTQRIAQYQATPAKAPQTDRMMTSIWSTAPLDSSMPPVFDSNPGARLRDLDFTPNRLTFSIANGREDARVVLNQNWAPGWSSTTGTFTVGPRTEVSVVAVPAGQSGQFSFTFVPPGLYTGSAVLAIALVLSAFCWRRRTMTRR